MAEVLIPVATVSEGSVSDRKSSKLWCVKDWAEIDGFESDEGIKGYCYGCGALLQVEDAGRIGFVEREKYDAKAKFKQYDQLLCSRCISLSHGKMVPAVMDLHQQATQSNATGLVSPDEFRTLLMEVRRRVAIVVLLVDLLDLPGSFLNKIRDLVGKNPVVLVGTKFDLLPKGTSPAPVVELLRDLAESRRITVISSHLVSSKTGQGIPKAASSLLRNRRGRDVFVMGVANVGKSAFVRALLKDMRSFSSINFEMSARANAKFLPMESSMPGTTMGMIPLQAFPRGAMLYDTPGLHIFHRVLHLLSPDEMASLHPRRRLRPYIAPSPLTLFHQSMGDGSDDDDFDSSWGSLRPDPETVSACYEWGSIARIEILEAPPSTSIVFYGPKVLRIESKPLDADLGEPEEAEDAIEDVGNIFSTMYQNPSNTPKEEEVVVEDSQQEEDSSQNEKEQFGKASVELRGGLTLGREFEVLASGIVTRVGDISISGVCGWASIIVPYGGGLVRGRVYVPRGVQVYIRPYMPVPDPLKQDDYH